MGFVGRVFRAERLLCAESVRAFAALTGDANPIHACARAAAAAGFAAPIVPGMLLAALFPALIAAHLPGTVYLRQELRFAAAVPVGARVAVEVAVRAERALRGRWRLRLATTARGEDGRAAVEGEAEVLVRADSPNL